MLVLCPARLLKLPPPNALGMLVTNVLSPAHGRCAALRFFTCGEPVERDGGAEAAPPPFSFEADMAAAKAQASMHALALLPMVAPRVRDQIAEFCLASPPSFEAHGVAIM